MGLKEAVSYMLHKQQEVVVPVDPIEKALIEFIVDENLPDVVPDELEGIVSMGTNGEIYINGSGDGGYELDEGEMIDVTEEDFHS